MMKLFLGLSICLQTLQGFCQIEEIEKQLKKQAPDSLEGWNIHGTIALNFSQVSLTNWSAGGQNAITANGLWSVSAIYKKQSGLWENYLDIGYGNTKQGKHAPWWKSDDKIDYTSKYGQRASKNWYYAALLNFKTQMTKGYNYPDDSTIISDLLAPGYFISAIGLDYKPGSNFAAFIAPVTAKMTFVNNQHLADEGAFGVEPAVIDSKGSIVTHGLKRREEIGGYVRISFKHEILQNITLQTKAEFFTNYLKYPQNIDVSWETLISMKINKYISATVQTHLMYDDDIDIAVDVNKDGVVDRNGPATQFKEVLGIGFSYKF